MGLGAFLGCFAFLTMVMVILAAALLTRDFRFAYVAEYSSRSLPWHYALSALWVGQAGSLLLWAWLLNGMALIFRFWPWQAKHALRDSALGIVMGYLCYLLLVMVFAADPMAPMHSIPREGGGLSPLLQHPSMLFHPPIVFAGYAAWTFPFALAVAALLRRHMDRNWVSLARPWALIGWTVLGLGILFGGHWAYQELGWGGYWAWDPVENGSLIPWLTGTALVHGLMVWQHCDALKKTCLALAIATFGLCNFATFLTRSGVFSSVHAFSQSSIGWMFLALMLVLATGAMVLIVLRRHELRSTTSTTSWLTRETLAMISIVLLVVLSLVVIGGTTMGALSTFVIGRTVLIGPPFYNNVLIPVGILVLAMTALAPVLRWRRAPTTAEGKLFLWSALAAIAIAGIAVLVGMRHPLTLLVIGLAALVFCTFVAALLQEKNLQSFLARRRQHAGFIIHVGLAMLAVGVAGSSFGTRRLEATMDEGQTVAWAGRDIQFHRLIQRTLPDKLVAEAELEVRQASGRVAHLLPARHLFNLQNEWTTEVAIDSTWMSDFYVILHSGEGGGRITLTLIENPLMRWIWSGAGVMAGGALLAIWPKRRRKATANLVIQRKPKATRAHSRHRHAA
jgi:cytochrome c-type biogenesis protein CcmF